jgi:hypothetical protein
MQQIPLNSNLTDALSQQAHDLLAIDHDSAYAKLVVHGNGNAAAAKALRKIGPNDLLTKPAVCTSDAQCLLSALWLWHDWLDESHVISQNVQSATGSFWHAIMHRREGDFSNSKYWYARCRDHPVLEAMTPFANDILHLLPADKSLLKLVLTGWDPDRFVDLAEEVHHRPDDARHNAAVMLQRLEWRLLFDHCMRAATGQ